MYISNKTIDGFIKEDVPYLDLTTHVLEIGNKKGRIRYISRQTAVLSGTEVVVRIFEKLEIKIKRTAFSFKDKTRGYYCGRGRYSRKSAYGMESLHEFA